MMFKTFALTALICLVSTTEASKKASPCESEALETCIGHYKMRFQFSRHPIVAYCHAYQIYGDCLANAECSGHYLDMHRMMIYMHMAIDKRTNLCPDHNYQALEDKVQENVEYKKGVLMKIGKLLENDDVAPCSVSLNTLCATELANNLHEKEISVCGAIGKYIKCYTTEEEIPCEAKLIKHYRKILLDVARPLVGFGLKGESPDC